MTSERLTNRFYNITQFRADLWNNFKQTASQLENKVNSNENSEIKKRILDLFDNLKIVEQYWAYPGIENLTRLKKMYDKKEYASFSNSISEIVRMLISESYRDKYSQLGTKEKSTKDVGERQHYFEVLFIDNLSHKEEAELKEKFSDIRNTKDKFIYDIVVTKTFQDALIALLFNYNIQSVVIRYGIQFKSKNNLKILKPFISSILKYTTDDKTESELGPILANIIKAFRPELDLYYVTDTSLDKISTNVFENFRRIFYRQEDIQELHLSLRRGILERFETPFFTALTEYSQRPTGVFHAMPISRGNSIFKSHWIHDMSDFYGRNIFLAETSATTGGLDSLLQPTGPLKKAQELAAKSFGSQHTYFVTNGTSTANKIVQQALVQPGDIVLIDRDCHKSHHYALVLAGAFPVYLDSYPIQDYSIYGAVPLEEIKNKLYELKEAGNLNKVKMLVLTNCTFDGLVYNVEKVMQEILSIKPDMIFLWDEAWFGFASFTSVYRQRTAMNVASKLCTIYKSEEYRKKYNQNKKSINNSESFSNLPDPDKVKIRVYSTQSTHKTLSSLRQGSMIHIFDEEFRKKVEDTFHEAYMTHTSTSANYQILASLDVGRRQTAFEAYELVEKSIEMAMILREKITSHPRLNKYFHVLTIKDIIPEKHRDSGIAQYYDTDNGWSRMEKAWANDEFVLDPTKVTLFIGNTGVDGDTFKNRYLMDQFGIQINKTSRNTVLFMTNIGTRRSSVAYLLGVLLKIAKQIEETNESLNNDEADVQKKLIHSLNKENPPLPDFSRFHAAFRPNLDTSEGDIRSAFFLAYNEEICEYVKLKDCYNVMDSGRELVSASFVIPYPPGFPVLIPGQVFSKEIIDFMNALDVKEIHGYRSDLGFRVFSEDAVKSIESKQIAKKITANISNIRIEPNGGHKRKENNTRKKKVEKVIN